MIKKLYLNALRSFFFKCPNSDCTLTNFSFYFKVCLWKDFNNIHEPLKKVLIQPCWGAIYLHIWLSDMIARFWSKRNEFAHLYNLIYNIANMTCLLCITRGPQALTVIWVLKALDWPVKGSHFCILGFSLESEP